MTYFVGVDLTSAFASRPRPIDVAVLDDALNCTFHRADWPGRDAVIAREPEVLWKMIRNIVPDGQADQVWAVDGPQALATAGTTSRICEIVLSTPGRTPATLPAIDDKGPFQGYIRSSVDLFAALIQPPGAFTLADGPTSVAGVTLFEVFPGAEWVVANGRRLPAKRTPSGRLSRRQMFEELGVAGIRGLPTADHNDALMAAYLAWSARHRPRDVELVGSPAFTDQDGALREGMILHLRSTLLKQPVIAEDPNSTVLPDQNCTEDWTDDDCPRLWLTDTGLAHGNTPENRWLETGKDYVCETQPPHRRQRFTLRHNKKFSGGRGWTCDPTIPVLLTRLGLPMLGPISKTAPVRLRIQVVKGPDIPTL